MEKWVPIKGYELLYRISSHGIVESLGRTVMTGKNLLRTYERKFLSPVTTRGYLRVGLCKNGKVKSVSVARLVGLHFVDGWFPSAQINHINGVKTDNRSVNLEWTTPKENTIHAHSTGLVKGFIRSAEYCKNLSEQKKGLKHPFSKIILDKGNGVFYYSIIEAAKAKGIKRRTLNSWLNNEKLNQTQLSIV